jgi:hypothetical protein
VVTSSLEMVSNIYFTASHLHGNTCGISNRVAIVFLTDITPSNFS